MNRFVLTVPGALLAVAFALCGCAHPKPVATPGDPVIPASRLSATTANSAESVEQEFKKLQENDDDARAEVDQWIRDNLEFAALGGGIPPAELNRRIRRRLEPVEKGYAAFILRNPIHVKARLAYASFLSDINDEEGEMEQLEKARELDANDPAMWNNLANYYGHHGPVTNAFNYYEKAIALDPTESLYYHNFGTTVFLFRKDAREYYNIDEQQVFSKALGLYGQAMRLDPTNFLLASDVALTYYGIKPPRTSEALLSWTNALQLARDEIEREGVYLHLARIKMSIGQFDEARAHLNAVTNEMYGQLIRRLTRNLHERESGTNSPSAPDRDELSFPTNSPPDAAVEMK